jgi:phosphohistidine phosphatase
VRAHKRLKKKLPTAGLVIIDFDFDDWSKLREESGRLDRFISPRSLR